MGYGASKDLSARDGIMRNLLILLVLFSFINLSFIGCSSKDSVKEEGEIQTFLEEIDSEKGEEVTEGDEDEEAEDYDDVAEEDEDEEGSDTEEQDNEIVVDSESSDDESSSEESPSALAEIENDVDSDIVEDNSGLSEVTEEPQDEVAFEEETEESPVRKWIPVKKVKTEPFRRGNLLANAIYIVRDGDSLASISEKIYGSDRSEDLLAINPHFRGKGIKIGDKVYYNSPLRPDDSGQIMNFYEERGLAPQVYISQAGDNIRQVSKKLLGHSRSWMEVYAINAVDSKGELEPGVELRYWSDSVAEVPLTPLVQEAPQEVVNQEPPVAEEPPVVQESVPEEINPPVEVAEVPQGDIPPPPPIEPPPVEAEPEVAANNTPPPVVPQESKEVVDQEESLLEGLPIDEVILFSIGGGIVVLLGVILFIVRRRKASQMAAFEEAIFDEEIAEDGDEDIEKTHVGH